MKALDLFCGLGGWSDGLAMEGFEVLGVEIEPKIAELYKHKVIVVDVRDLDGKDFKGYDLIVGSPPCREFTQLPDHSITKKGVARAWVNPKNPKEGLKNVHAFLKIVKEGHPRFWLMENVSGLCSHIHINPTLETHLSYSEKGFKAMKRCFWGQFPPFLIFRGTTIGKERIGSKIKKWERAKIPLPVARALGRAVKEALDYT